MKLVQFGAGNIGRSFLGQLFSRAGWEVVFVDVNPTLVDLLNHRRSYTVVIKREGLPDERRLIRNVRAVNGRDSAEVVEELSTADLAATSVGKAALAKILPDIARGLALRRKRQGDLPLDLVIAENARGADKLFREMLSAELGPDYPLEDLVGLVETSIGKMVPIMRAADLAEDPLQVFAEEYEELILDELGFRGPVPDMQGFHLVKDIRAYVDRKLFIHNLGHAAAAYLSYRADPRIKLLADSFLLPGIEEGAWSAMKESADALAEEYPSAYSRADLAAHINDLLFRFKNHALGDTVHRVGRDLRRKMDREDRVVGPMLLCARRGLPFGAIAQSYLAALDFSAQDEEGRLFPSDEWFLKELLPQGLDAVLAEVSHLDRENPVDAEVISAVKSYQSLIKRVPFHCRPPAFSNY